LGALRYFKRNNIRFKRNTHITFVPDEETGGVDGMKEFVLTDDFKNLNVGCALDEGMPSESEIFNIYYAERSIWRTELIANGVTGHGSLLLEDTVGEKVTFLLQRFSDFRKSQVDRLKNDPQLTVGDVTTVNVTILSGGVQSNVIPPQFRFMVDIRLAIDVDHEEFEKMLNRWCEEAGGNIQIEFEFKDSYVAPTKIDDSNIFWVALKRTFEKL
jgi:aminoacylase